MRYLLIMIQTCHFALRLHTPLMAQKLFCAISGLMRGDKSLKYIRLTLPLRESKTSQIKRRKLWILFVEESNLPLMFIKDRFVFSQLVSLLSLCVAQKRGSQSQPQLGCKDAPFPQLGTIKTEVLRRIGMLIVCHVYL